MFYLSIASAFSPAVGTLGFFGGFGLGVIGLVVVLGFVVTFWVAFVTDVPLVRLVAFV